jgi:hypothetical protein
MYLNSTHNFNIQNVPSWSLYPEEHPPLRGARVYSAHDITSTSDNLFPIEPEEHPPSGSINLTNGFSRYTIILRSSDDTVLQILYVTPDGTHDITSTSDNLFLIGHRNPQDLTNNVYNLDILDCCVCFEKIVERIILVPCYHSATCKKCIYSCRKKCPLCKTLITSIEIIE